MAETINKIACPDRSVLMAYASGSLAESDADSLLSHLETCTNCQQQADELAGADDSLLNVVRGQVSVDGSLSQDAQLQKLIDDACRNDTLPKASEQTKVTKKDDPITLAVFVSCLKKSQFDRWQRD